MRNIVLVIKHELSTTLGKRSFWLTTFLLPLMILGFSVLPQIMTQKLVSESGLNAITGQSGSLIASGYVDKAAIIKGLPSDIPASALIAYPDEEAANAALSAGAIAKYFVVAGDYIETGKLVLVSKEFSLMTSDGDTSLLEYVIDYSLIGNAATARLSMNPLGSTQEHAIEPVQDAVDDSNPLGYALPYAVMFILFFTITMSGGYMLQSVAGEKENRTAEVLLLSLRPVDLMVGKVLGLGVVAMLQMAIWLGGGLLAFDQGKTMTTALAAFNISPTFALWAVIYCLLGYLVYSSELGAIGALAPSVREGSQFTFAAIVPLILPMWFNYAFTSDPNGTLATVLSLIPLTAPTAMMTRMVAVTVPLWQQLVSVGGLALTAYLFVWMSSRFFRADTLLSQASISWRRIGQELRR